jgi:hypothetical protein
MNIAFWSNVRHQSGVTAGVALMSVLWVELFVEEIAITSNHICNHSLIKRLYGGVEQEEKAARKTYSYVLGEPEYFRMLYGGKMQTTLWLNENLRFIPMESRETELFSIEGLEEITKRMSAKEYLLIDTACGYGLSSQKILEEADVTVVMFPPCRECIDAFFQSKSFLCKDSFFIVGNYLKEESFLTTYLTRRYGIPEAQIGVIPYNPGFAQAMKEGDTISYITRNMNCSKRNGAYHWIYNAKKTVNRLRDYVMSRRHLCEEYGKVPEENSGGD